MSYALDMNAARSADMVGGGIKETGKYVGVITRAEALVSTKGTKGLGISFKSNAGESANYLDLWTHTKDGEALSSLRTVSAILACLKIRSIEEGAIRFETWNRSTNQKETVNRPGYPVLMGKKIGFLLRKEIELDDHGQDREKVVIYAVFDAETELTASEILDKKTKPEVLSKMFDALMAKPVYDRRKNSQKTAPAKPSTHGGASPFSDMDDDIPF